MMDRHHTHYRRRNYQSSLEAQGLLTMPLLPSLSLPLAMLFT